MSSTEPRTTVATQASIKRFPFGPPVLLEGEDEAAYNELLLQVSNAVKPADPIEEICLHDFVARTWEVSRWRCLKAALLTANASNGLQQVLRRLMDPEQADGLAERWATGNGRAARKVDRLLAKAKLTMEAVLAETLATKFDDFERIERLEATAELRRNAVLHEIERHRANFASSLRRAAATVEDAVALKPAPTLPGEPP